jgi:BirA family transcriptional regulator, biotin operon repressor / biotin---[acetyl-CoA-carboxylase] ligase
MKSIDDIRKGLETSIFGGKLFVFDSIDSTNTCARLLAECGVEEGAIVYAEEQTRGRGRLNRSWESDKGMNLLFSVIFSPRIHERKYYLIPLMVSSCIIDSVRPLLPESPPIVKWPNDILLGSGEKIGGILTELTHTYEHELRIVVGVGLNVNQVRFPGHLTGKVSSVKLASGYDADVDRTALFHSIVTAIESRYPSVGSDPESIIERWRSYCSMFGKSVRVSQGSAAFSGICKDIDRDGALIVETGNRGTVRVLAGDVTSVAVNSEQR